MKYYDWDENKNEHLKANRNVSFEEIILAISNNQLLDVLTHPNIEKYPDQKMFIVELFDYAYIVPFVEDDEKYFLKTIYPSHEATKKYLKKEE
jgi:uncharacterized DUF497 family protein